MYTRKYVKHEYHFCHGTKSVVILVAQLLMNANLEL